MNYKVWVSAFLLSIAGAFLVNYLSEDPIDWSKPPQVFEKPQELMEEKK
jgi:hypothetical protein